ncbi:MAG: apolipoprotein N-acyltransferase [Cycloclasticus sp. symbiont of Poecilosclerida sp. N]|nr:MAG: apolipoprotein N-acyltransferase [Cycloclasticus sp. symbiont of Poecilosclerida sp. N]
MLSDRLKQKAKVGFALISGALLPLAFAPYDMPAMAIVGLLFFLIALNKQDARKSAWLGYAFGWGYFGHGVYWVYFSIHHFAHAPLWLAIIITLGMVAILALYMALFAYLLNRFFQSNLLLRYLLAFPGLWVGLEACRAVFFTGFPWLSLGYSQIDTWLAGWAPIFGVLGVSWFLALTSGAIFCVVYCQKIHKIMTIILVFSSWSSGWALQKINWVEPAGEPLKTVLLQGNIPQEIKWDRDFRQTSLDIYMQMTKRQRDADIIVWPETAIPAFYHTVQHGYMQILKAEAQAYQSDIILGLPLMLEGTKDYYNSLHSVREPKDFYLKRHLVPLGEYIPLKPLSSIILGFMNIPLSDFSAGEEQQPLLQAGGYAFASSICYEDIFQQTSIDGLPEAAYLVNVSNDTWFGDTIAPYQHFQMARMRALESGRYLLRSTNTGLTAIVNQRGEVTHQAPMFKRVALKGEMQPLKGAPPFVQGGWWLIYVLIVSVLLVGFLKRDRKE